MKVKVTIVCDFFLLESYFLEGNVNLFILKEMYN